MASPSSAAAADSKAVRLSIVGSGGRAASGTSLAYSTSGQPVTKLALNGGTANISVSGDKLRLFVDDPIAGQETLLIDLPGSPSVAIAVHVDGKIRADVLPIFSGKPREQSSASLRRSLSQGNGSVKSGRPGSVTTKSVAPSSVNARAAGLGTQLPAQSLINGKPVRVVPVDTSGQGVQRGCSPACPPNAISENEANCGLPTDTVNGGCNSTPPVFTSISCGDTVCGTSAFDGTTRDTDWYKVVLTAPTQVTWTGNANFDLLIGIVNNFGVDSCAGVTSFLAFNTSTACVPASATACLPAGTWYLFIAPQFTANVACGAAYTATLTCGECQAGSGNDECTGAENLLCNSSVVVDNSTATNNPLDPAYSCHFGGPAQGVGTLWYSFVATDTSASLTTCNSAGSFDTLLAVYSGTCVNLVEIACNDDAQCGPFGFNSTVCASGLTIGQTYLVQVASYSDADRGSITLELACPCGGGGGCTVTCDPTKTQENEPDCGIPVDTVDGGCNSSPPIFKPIACGQRYCGTSAFDGSTRDTDWYEIVLTQQTFLTWTVQAEFDVLVGVVDNQGGALDCSQVTAFLTFATGGPCQDTAVSACLSAGTWWLFVAPQFTNVVNCGAVYNAELQCADCPPGPPNDHCDGAEMILCNSTTNVDNSFATTDATDPAYSCHFGGPAQGVGTLWYTFVATDTSAQVSTCNSAVSDTLIAVYSGTCGSLVEIACNDDFCGGSGFLSQVCATGLTVGQTYYIQLASYDSASQGSLSMDLNCPCPAGPAGDLCDDAIALTIPADVFGSTIGATTDSPPAFTCGGFAVTAPGVWYTVVGDGNMLTASLCNPGTTYDTKIFVYCGTCTQLFCVGGDDDFCGFPPGYSQLSWCSIPGTLYHILVSGFGSGTGDFELTVTSGAACNNPIPCEACNVICDKGKTPENEPDCGLPVDTVNGGCNSVPPIFSPLTCGQRYCGTSAFDGSTRDTDWYELVLSQQTFVTWTVRAEFDLLSGIVDNQGGALDCSQVTAFLVFATASPCQDATVSACLSAGRWWFFVAPQFTSNVTCGAEYNASLTCDDCPPGPPNDGCDGAIMINCNSVTNADNTFATTDATDPPYSCRFGGAGQGVGTLWYTFVASNTSAQLSTCNSASTDTMIAVYSGTCGNLTEIACNDDLPCGPTTFLSQLCVLNLTVGQTYYVQLSSFSAADVGPIELDLVCPCPGVEPTGACCVDGVCTVTTQSQCAGDYLGDGTNCNSSGGTPTVYQTSPNLVVPDSPAAGVSSTINVPDSFTIGDLNVDLQISHTWVGDLIVTLTHNSTTVTLVDRPGVPAAGTFGCSSDNYDIVLDDQGTGGAIEDLCTPSMVSPPNYTPNNPLAAFNGMNASGAWVLSVSDNAGGDTGTLLRWSLHIDVPGESPCNIEPCVDCPAGTIPIVDAAGDNSGWCASVSDPLNVVIHVDDVNRSAGTASLHIEKDFKYPPGFGGLIPCILIDFVQVCPDVRTVDTFLINGETICNGTGVTWRDFHWLLFDGPEAWFDVAASDGFNTTPFLSKLFSGYIDSPTNNKAKNLDAYNGVVLAGNCFSPSGGTSSGGTPFDVVRNPNLAIPDSPTPGVSDTMVVPNSVTIGDLNVDLAISHSWVGDLIVTLTHGSTSVILVDRPGVPATTFGCSNDNYNIVLDDQGTGGTIEALCAASMVSPPNYVPNNPLSAFNGANSAGPWVLSVSDNAGGDTGTLLQWSLHVTPQAQVTGEPLTIGVDLGGPPVSFTLKECATTTGQVSSGACCIGLSCSILAPADCNRSGGVYKGDGTVCTPTSCLPANDDCNNCIPVLTGVTYNGSNAGATGTDISSCAFNDFNDVWHCWTATCTGPATISLCGSNYDTTLAVYNGSCTGPEIACNDDFGGCPGGAASQVVVNVTAGTTYYIRIAGFNGDSGNYTLNVTCNPVSGGTTRRQVQQARETAPLPR